MKIVFLFLFTFLAVDCLKLEEVFILSRHNLRTPLSESLQHVTPLLMPKWDTEPGFLTPKGFLLEEYMGDYFSEWFRKVNLFTDCPNDDSVFIYSNVKQRTIETAKAFAKSAFKNCNVTVYFKKKALVDPVFNPIITNETTVFKELYTKSVQEKLDNLQLKNVLKDLEKIIDIKNSLICTNKSFCDLAETKNEILLQVGEEPDIVGPLSIGNSLVDAFLMKYYSGAKTEEIAWGKITTEEQWKELLQITWENQNVRFNNTLATDIAKHMLKLIKNTFLDPILARKFTMLVGHDSNLNCILAALNFKKYNLTGQFERTPIGGKIVFQKWQDDEMNNFLKVEYVYQTKEQLRNGSKLSLENPPKTVVLELNDCAIDEKGFCPFSAFVKILESIN